MGKAKSSLGLRTALFTAGPVEGSVAEAGTSWEFSGLHSRVICHRLDPCNTVVYVRRLSMEAEPGLQNHLGLHGKHVVYPCDVQLPQVAEVRNSISGIMAQES